MVTIGGVSLCAEICLELLEEYVMMTKGQKKVGKVMSEFKSGKLTSSGKTVKNPKQAIAIALSYPVKGQRAATNKAKRGM